MSARVKRRVRRGWWLARVAFHDWMWGRWVGPKWLRRQCQRLPFYFSDPYWMSAEEFDRVLAENDPVIFLPRKGVTITSGTWQLSTTPQTYSYSTAVTLEWRP